MVLNPPAPQDKNVSKDLPTNSLFMARLCIDQSIFEQFPDVCVGVAVVKDVDNTVDTANTQKQLRQLEGRIRKDLSPETLSDHPNIRPWRTAYQQFGAKPKKHRSSIENLCLMILEGQNLRSINPLVDAYNVISLTHLLPVGGEDLSRIKGDIVLTVAGDNEPEVELLGDTESHSPKPGEIIYRDDISAICRRWNWREADRTKLTPETTSAVLVIESLPPVTRDEIKTATKELSTMVKKLCGGSITESLLDRSNSTIELSLA